MRVVLMVIDRGCKVVAGIRDKKYMNFLLMLGGSVLQGQCAIGARQNGGRFHQREATLRGEFLLAYQSPQNYCYFTFSQLLEAIVGMSPPFLQQVYDDLVSKPSNLLGHCLQPQIYLRNLQNHHHVYTYRKYARRNQCRLLVRGRILLQPRVQNLIGWPYMPGSQGLSGSLISPKQNPRRMTGPSSKSPIIIIVNFCFTLSLFHDPALPNLL